jgi:hypothetical protein
MGNDKFPTDDQSNREAAEEGKLRDSALMGSEQPTAADHVDCTTARSPDTELHLDGEENTLYSDGPDIKEDSETLFGTRGVSPRIIKP